MGQGDAFDVGRLADHQGRDRCRSLDQGSQPELHRPRNLHGARRRGDGYTEAEISRILTNQASGVGSQQPAGAAPVQGKLSGILRNASAAISYARSAIFGIRGDIGYFFNRTAPPPLERARSGGFLVFKAAIVTVICFAIYQESRQHIIYQTEFTKTNAPKVKAESCAARMQAYNNGTPKEELQRRTVDDQLLRDCDPTYVARETQCDARSKAIAADLDHLKAGDHEAADRVMKQVRSFNEGCRITGERQKVLKEAAGRAVAVFPQGSEQPKATDDAARAAMAPSFRKSRQNRYPCAHLQLNRRPRPLRCGHRRPSIALSSTWARITSFAHPPNSWMPRLALRTLIRPHTPPKVMMSRPNSGRGSKALDPTADCPYVVVPPPIKFRARRVACATQWSNRFGNFRRGE